MTSPSLPPPKSHCLGPAATLHSRGTVPPGPLCPLPWIGWTISWSHMRQVLDVPSRVGSTYAPAFFRNCKGSQRFVTSDTCRHCTIILFDSLARGVILGRILCFFRICKEEFHCLVSSVAFRSAQWEVTICMCVWRPAESSFGYNCSGIS